jgi:hypothetical protein
MEMTLKAIPNSTSPSSSTRADKRRALAYISSLHSC